MPGKLIKMDNNEMLLFIDLMQKEYNEKENEPDKRINIDNVLNKVFNDE
mgnify:CR=1 FL=1